MKRRVVTIAVRPLRAAPDTGLSELGTAESRLALVETLTREAWSISGHDLPTYTRATTPIRVCPLRPTAGQRLRERSDGE